MITTVYYNFFIPYSNQYRKQCEKRQKHYQLRKPKKTKVSMKDTPKIPEDIDTEKDFKQYINQLQNHIQFLEEELETSEKDKIELQQELDSTVESLRDNVSQQEDINEFLGNNKDVVESMLDNLAEKMEEAKEHMEDRGGISDSNPVADTVNDITGEDYGK